MSSVVRASVAALVAVCAYGCGPKPSDVVTPPAVFERGITREGNTSWIRMPFPDSKFEPGSVVVIERNDARWIGHVRDCGIPADVVVVNSGNIGDLKFESTRTLSAEAVLKIGGIKAGPKFDRARTSEFVQKGMSADALNLIRLQLWLSEPANQAKIAGCDSILGKPDAFILGESARVAGGSYSLKGSDGTKIGIEGIKAGVLEIDPSAEAKAEANGDLVLTKPVYTHFRRVKRVDHKTLIVLGSGTTETFDDSLLLQKAGAKPN